MITCEIVKVTKTVPTITTSTKTLPTKSLPTNFNEKMANCKLKISIFYSLF